MRVEEEEDPPQSMMLYQSPPAFPETIHNDTTKTSHSHNSQQQECSLQTTAVYQMESMHTQNYNSHHKIIYENGIDVLLSGRPCHTPQQNHKRAEQQYHTQRQVSKGIRGKSTHVAIETKVIHKVEPTGTADKVQLRNRLGGGGEHLLLQHTLPEFKYATNFVLKWTVLYNF